MNYDVYRCRCYGIVEYCNRTEAKKLLKRDLLYPLEDECTDDDTFGYIVGIGNVDIWIPEEVFLAYAHKTNTRIDRLNAEADELRERMNRLHKFLFSNGGYAISDEERSLLKNQHDCMTLYMDTIQRRIALAKKRGASKAPAADF